MIITGDTVSMESSRKYKRTMTSSSQAVTTGGNGSGSRFGVFQNSMFSGNFAGILNYSLDDVKNQKTDSRESGLLGNITDRDQSSKGARGVASTEKSNPFSKSFLQIQAETLDYLFQLLLGKRFQRSGFAMAQNDKTNMTLSYSQTFTYEETETTTFSTSGKVKTADGREIEFGIDVVMSRSFYEEYRETYSRNIAQYLDPLVINLDENVTSVSDQKFFFDLDCDGTEDEIYALGGGSGFLALDKNEDGIINDGSEVFGAKTGNGFSELAAYDIDGNGWIDEADEVFDRLKVWTKDESGRDLLLTLKEAGVGALCLKSAVTPFSVNDANNDPKALIRQSGFYLKENGIPGLLQQVDMAM